MIHLTDDGTVTLYTSHGGILGQFSLNFVVPRIFLIKS